MTDPTTDAHLTALTERAHSGESDALEELVEAAAGGGDAAGLRRMSDAGTATATATDQLAELTGTDDPLRDRRPGTRRPGSPRRRTS